MKTRKLTCIYFSPSGTTKFIVNQIAKSFDADSINDINLLKDISSRTFDEDDLVIIGMPVFSGRIPVVCEKLLSEIKGNNTPAIAVVAYGNREYEDALLELYNIMKANGFNVYGAGAFIAQHSIFPKVAENRPDENDIKKIDEFAMLCKDKIDNEKTKNEELTIKGNVPYRERLSGGTKQIPLPLSGECNSCKACSNICPVKAIDNENVSNVESEKCICCMACLYACPKQIRIIQDEEYVTGGKIFYDKFNKRKEPEFFV